LKWTLGGHVLDYRSHFGSRYYPGPCSRQAFFFPWSVRLESVFNGKLATFLGPIF
jgi:hypothetical protein